MTALPILFIHGFGGGTHEFASIIRFLKKDGNPLCYEFSYEENMGQVSLKTIAEQLNTFIVKNVSEPKFDIIAISQGGVIARYYIAKYSDKKIRKCITLCSPHAGSLVAYAGFLPGMRDLQPQSDFLQELDHSSAEYYAVYNPFDLMVFPGWHARLPCAKENKMVLAPLHQLTFSNKATLKFIAGALAQT